ncbi:2-oxoglutarate dehydrogenase E1 component [Rickettsia endosymbiont of Cardiosporidium cionae]|uniref:2-oxoglutarate dehydrogenase E1 component n=1 Tax=Rickettsia endosymbiont of Cardiosporidium cionae TaxID=2777155 RepID=UPI001893D55F|nr:2-oxoglutarate dehydrogenase E1 component [Rickettsia endosymbiont of Cardiosporidium cionae]
MNNFESEDTQHLFAENAVFIEGLYQKYLINQDSVSQEWQVFFEKYTPITINKDNKSNPDQNSTKNNVTIQETKNANTLNDDHRVKSICNNEDKIINDLRIKFLIERYREYGHYLTKLDPLSLEPQLTETEVNLDAEYFGFDKQDLIKKITVNCDFYNKSTTSLANLITKLKNTYCSNIAVEFAHIEDMQKKTWLYNNFEELQNNFTIQPEYKTEILKQLIKVESFEQYLHNKFPGAKRFSIEGGEAYIICLDHLTSLSAENGTKDIVLGLAHRGRLSTMTSIMEKPYSHVFAEFSNISSNYELDVSGDVKYHMGYSSDKLINEKSIHLSLTPNPSHLESVNPVVAGKVKAKQFLNNNDKNSVVAILVHGDAAFCGQGVVSENLIMSSLKTYDIGGIIHIIINNQIGFTTDTSDARPNRYCTDIAKVVAAPILHVNADNIESVIIACEFAARYRQYFYSDIVIDLVCYRKYGHNEGDDPSYTQPKMYNVIKNKKSVVSIYEEKLVKEKLIENKYSSEFRKAFIEFLDKEFKQMTNMSNQLQSFQGLWSSMTRYQNTQLVTAVEKNKILEYSKKLLVIPKEYSINNKLKKIFLQRLNNIIENHFIDWASAEQLALATLLAEGVNIRFTGQDVERGTFSQRHAVLHDSKDGKKYTALNNIQHNQGYIEIANSNLSEYAALGFEYGYSLVNPKHLVIWEAQFGDFANGAQIIFDQFISSGEMKWLRMSGIVILLPHGYEGQGPEHSSARLERFLQLSAENNMKIVYPSTPASIFHLLRSQIKDSFRIPMIVMSPKSLLRNKLCISDLSDITDNSKFIPVLDEIDNNTNIKKIVFCTGKIYYDLFTTRRKYNIKDVKCIRLEQLYPFPSQELKQILEKYKNAKQFIWCQEESENMGAWNFVKSYITNLMKDVKIHSNIIYHGRQASASPTSGYSYIYQKEQDALIKNLFEI